MNRMRPSLDPRSGEPRDLLQSLLPRMSGPRAYAIGQDELQRRLKKLHDEKDLIVNVLDHLLKRMDLMVAHGSSLTNMNQFLCYFMDATSTMEHMYMKLFKIHVLLTEDTYVDAEQERVPHMAITYSFHASSDQNSNSQLAVLEASKDSLNCLPSGSQHPSSPHLSICDEVLGRQTSAASFALPQETAAAISSLTAAYARLANVVGTTQDIVLSFYKTPSEFWIQLDSSASTLEDILKRLHEYYSSRTQRREFTAKPGMYCAAYYAEDGHWYRARILQVLKDHAKVFYIDFGNSDRVNINYVCFLEEEFTSLPAQALCCTIKNVKSTCGPGLWSFPAIRAFRDKISGQGTKLQAFFHSQDIVTGRYTVDILSVKEGNVSINLSQEFLTTCSSGYLQPNNQKAFNCATKLPVTHPAVTASKATTSTATTASAVTCSVTMPRAGTIPTTTTSAHTTSQPGMPSGPVLSVCMPPPGMFSASMPAASTPSTGTLPCRVPPASVAPVCTPQLGAPLAGPPPTGKAPPPVGMAPPPAGMAPPPAGMAPPPAGMAPPPAGMAPPPAGMAPPPAGMAPPPAGMAPPPAGMAPPPAGMAPPPAGMAPPLASMAPPPAGMSPPPAHLSASPTDMSPPPTDMSAAATGTTSSPAGTTSSPAGTAPPSAATAISSTTMAAMAPAAAPLGGMQPPGMYPATLHPAYLQLASTSPPAVVPPAILPEGNTFCVCLSVVFNPSDFYGQIVEKANPTVKVLEDLQQNLNRFGSQSEAPVEEMVTKGSFWICRFQGDKNWYRAQVLDVLPGPNCRFRVLYVDYGNRSTVLCSFLRPLPPELASLPACAHRMSLAHVGPKQGNKWDESAIGVFVKETGFNISLIAEKKGHRRAGFEDITEVVLWNRNGPTAVNINVVLVEQDVAVLKAAE
ncbi:hypothetical protein MTO96_037339 [Rhipicephalus appendiculatus]